MKTDPYNYQILTHTFTKNGTLFRGTSPFQVIPQSRGVTQVERGIGDSPIPLSTWVTPRDWGITWVPGLYLVCTWSVPGLYLVCTWSVPGLYRCSSSKHIQLGQCYLGISPRFSPVLTMYRPIFYVLQAQENYLLGYLGKTVSIVAVDKALDSIS